MIEPVFTVRMSLHHGTAMKQSRLWAPPGPTMHTMLQPHALAWLTQNVGKRAKTRAAFDYHSKFRWWFYLPQPSMDNTRESTWQQRAAWREHAEQAEFWFKDAHQAMLFKLSFS